MKVKIDGMDLDSLKFYRVYVDESLILNGKLINKGMIEESLELEDGEHEIVFQITKATDKKENDSMLNILASFIGFLSNDVRLNYFTIYHGVHEYVKIKGENLNDREIELKVDIPSEDCPYYRFIDIEGAEDLNVTRESDLNPGYQKRTYDRYKNLTLSVALILVALGIVLILSSNTGLHMYRTFAIGSILMVCGIFGYLKRSRIAKKQYENN